MAKRFKLSNKNSNKQFKKGMAKNVKNLSKSPSRGGIRL